VHGHLASWTKHAPFRPIYVASEVKSQRKWDTPIVGSFPEVIQIDATEKSGANDASLWFRFTRSRVKCGEWVLLRANRRLSAKENRNVLRDYLSVACPKQTDKLHRNIVYVNANILFTQSCNVWRGNLPRYTERTNMLFLGILMLENRWSIFKINLTWRNFKVGTVHTWLHSTSMHNILSHSLTRKSS